MLKIAICDDVIEITSQLEDMIVEISKKHSIEVGIEVFYSGDVLLGYINNGNNFDLIFLDIEMQIIDGIQVGNEIREYMGDNDTQIVYISGTSKYAMDLFKVRPFDFLIKPLYTDKVEKVLVAFLRIFHSKTRYFKYKKGQTSYKIDVEEILYFEGNNRKLNIITRNNTDSFYASIKLIYEDTKGLDFLHIHNSYIVNRLHIKTYAYDRVILSNNKELPISQSKRKSIRDKLLSSNKKSV